MIKYGVFILPQSIQHWQDVDLQYFGSLSLSRIPSSDLNETVAHASQASITAAAMLKFPLSSLAYDQWNGFVRDVYLQKRSSWSGWPTIYEGILKYQSQFKHSLVETTNNLYELNAQNLCGNRQTSLYLLGVDECDHLLVIRQNNNVYISYMTFK